MHARGEAFLLAPALTLLALSSDAILTVATDF